MRIGTLLNTYKIVPKVLYDLSNSKTGLASRPPWALRHLPDICVYWLMKALRLTELPKRKFNIQAFLDEIKLEYQIAELRKAGAEHFELSADLIFLHPQFEAWWMEQIPFLVSLRKEGITFSVHLPQFAGLYLDSYLNGVRQGAVAEIRRMHEIFKPLNPHYVLHLGSDRFFYYTDLHLTGAALQRMLLKTIGNKGWFNRAKMAGAKLVFQGLVKFITPLAVSRAVHPSLIRSLQEVSQFMPIEKLCIENLENFDFDSVMKRFNQEPLRSEIPVSVCLDVGHLIMQKWTRDPRCFEKFFARYGNRISCLHLHNVVKSAETVYDTGEREPVLQDHQPLNEEGGLLPLRKILAMVKKIDKKTGKNTVVVIELYSHDPLPSMRFLKETVGGM